MGEIGFLAFYLASLVPKEPCQKFQSMGAVNQNLKNLVGAKALLFKNHFHKYHYVKTQNKGARHLLQLF